MKLSITARHLKLTDGLAGYVTKKIERLEKYLDSIVDGHIRMGVEKYRHTIEVIIHSGGNVFKAVATGGDMYSAADVAAGKLENQLRRYKEKIKKRRLPSRRTLLPGRRKAAPAEEEAYVESMQEVIEFMPEPVFAALPAQAADQLRAEKRKYMLFLNPETDRVNLIYEGENGKYVIVEPEY